MSSIDAAVNAVLEATRATIRQASAFRAKWRGTSSGLAIIRRLTESANDGETYAYLAGFTPDIDDEVLCLPVAGKPVVLGKIVREAPASYSLDVPLVVPALRLSRPRPILGARPNPGATTIGASGTAAWTATGTAANADDATGPWLQVSTTATTGSAATVSSPALARIDWATAGEPVECVVRARLNQTADLRFWCGLFSGDPSGSNAPTASLVGFRYVAGTDADFRCASSGGSGISHSSSGVTPDTQPHEFRLILTPTQCTYLIDGTVVATRTANLPASGANLAVWLTVTNLASAVRSVRFGGAVVVSP